MRSRGYENSRSAILSFTRLSLLSFLRKKPRSSSFILFEKVRPDSALPLRSRDRKGIRVDLYKYARAKEVSSAFTSNLGKRRTRVFASRTITAKPKINSVKFAPIIRRFTPLVFIIPPRVSRTNERTKRGKRKNNAIAP